MRRPTKALFAVVVAMLVLGATAAFAIDTHAPGAPFDGSGTPNGFQSLAGVALDQSGGDVYAVDSFGAADFSGALDRFDNAGAFQGQIAGTFNNPQDVAIDSSGGGSDGNVYLTDTGNNLVYAFDSSGTAIASFGTAGQINGNDDGVADPDATPANSLSNPCGVAVDQSNGNLFVADQFNNRVWIFDSTGRYLDRVTDSSLSGPCGIALTSTGDLYVRNANDGRVLRFNKTGATAYDFNAVLYAADDGGFATDVATNPTDDHVYVDRGDRIVEYDSGGSQVSSFGQGILGGGSTGVAVDATSGTVYASDGSTLRTFGPLVTTTPPTAAIDPVDSGGVTATGAHLTGTVDPQGFDTTYRFEYSTDHNNWTPLADQGPLNSPDTVADDAAALQPNKTYFARLVASNGLDDPVSSSEESFRTDAIAPEVITGQARVSNEIAVDLTGTVNPNNSPTTYWFEYGTADCASNPCTSVPVSQDANAGSGGDPVSVERSIVVTTPDTTYHFRLVARNDAGTTEGSDQTFKMPPTASPAGPPGISDRKYELVSPPDKNGGDVVPDSARTRAAADGEAVSFISLAAFADAVGTSIATEYIAQRATSLSPGSSGWATHAINPVQVGIPFRALASQFEPKYEGEFSPDLDTGVFYSFGAVDGNQAVRDVGNLYLRTNLRRQKPGGALSQLLSPCLLCEATRTPLPPLPQLSALANLRRTMLAGMSPDGGHVVFETVHSLTSDAAAAQDGQCNLLDTQVQFCRVHVYEWDHGTLRVAGILPDGTVADASVAGDGVGTNHLQNRTPHIVSNGADGHTRVFFTQPTNARGQTSSELSAFARIQASRALSGRLFARIDGTSTIQLNETERTRSVEAFAPAQFLDASADGLRAFFRTTQALTNEAPLGNMKLYMYDASKPADADDNLTLLNPDGDESSNGVGIIGASDDGRYVYMIVAGQLVRGEQLLGNTPGIYLWHDGGIDFIGSIPDNTAVSDLQSTGVPYVLSPRQARVTPDGRHLLLTAINGMGLTRYDHGACGSTLGPGCREVYVYSADTGQLRCASCRPGGETATAMADVGVRTNNSGTGTSWHETNALSDDGRYVFFSTAEALVPEDTNGRSDAYLFDAVIGRPRLISSGRSTADSWFLDASGDGRDAFFLTRERLVGWDVDSAYDLYDARVGGGFPEPQTAPPGCSAESCQGLPGLAPAAANAGTTLNASGNVKPNRKPRCTKNQRKVRRNGRARCVRKNSKRANSNRRAGR